MKKNNMLAVLTIAMAVSIAATACGSKDNTKTTKAEQEISAEAGTTAKGTEADKTAKETEENQASSEGTEAETSEEAVETTVAVGDLAAGVFTPKSGKYQITLPNGWTVDDDSDESIIAFTSPNGNDLLEVTYVEGDDANDEREVYPDTKEEYEDLVSRGEDMEFVRYDVKNGSNGSQTFRYAIRYKNAEEGTRYYAVSGSYDAAAKKYILASGTIESEGSEVEGQIEAALDSLKLK